MGKPVISVIVLTYNSSNTIRNCLKALLNQKFEQAYEILVVDDSSTDDTCEIAREMGTRLIRLKRHTGNIGLLRNIGFSRAKAEIIAYTDSDCIPRKDWLDELYRGMEGESCVAGQTRNVAATIFALAYTKNGRKGFPNRLDKNGYRTNLSGANMAIRRSVLTKIGGFSSFKRWEDTELGIRLTKQGYKIKNAQNAVVYHLKSIDIHSVFRNRFIAGERFSFVMMAMGRTRRRVWVRALVETVVMMTTSFFKMTTYFITQKRGALRSFLDVIDNAGFLFGLLCGCLKQTFRTTEFLDYEHKIKSLNRRSAAFIKSYNAVRLSDGKNKKLC